jgi:CRP/FNR family nitrogen fixation transcriptional regulator
MDVARRALERYFPNSRRPPPVPGLRSSGSTLDDLAVSVRCRRGDLISGPGHSRQYWFKIVSGAAKRFSIHSDGRRQIVDLLLPGDFVGIGRDADLEFTVEAMTDGTVLARYSRHELEALASSEPAVALELCRIAFSTVSRLEAQLLILGRITAVEKVGAFLLDLAERLADQESQSVALPMSRYDMAEFLSLSVETVSRALSELKYRGLIRFAGTRQITIVDREALEHRPIHERKHVYTWHCQPKCETSTSLAVKDR